MLAPAPKEVPQAHFLILAFIFGVISVAFARIGDYFYHEGYYVTGIFFTLECMIFLLLATAALSRPFIAEQGKEQE